MSTKVTKIAYFRNLAEEGETKTFEEIFQETGVLEPKAKSYARWLIRKEGFAGSITDSFITFNATSEITEIGAKEFKSKPVFDINKRFSFLEKLIKMVISGIQPALFIAGDGGLGKTYTVMKTIKAENASPIIIKGFSTASGLYRLLHDNKDSLIVFDDCDSVFKDVTAANILKAATDSSDERIVSYNASIKGYEQSFEFTGQIIFISNLRTEKFPQALISRSTIANLDMTDIEKIHRIETVLPDINASCGMETKEFALDFMKRNQDRISDLNFRTLIKLSKIFKVEGCTEEAEELALFVICH